ncbi:VOC family protein [Carboxylicivirga sp. N1Y90]|uniref:VOC family protein n=1 Tax=Carboxylicivirga fragile TaxID=3417571 RepID=UPI003D341B46|nr:VOC family protein [Marinilabiliaceae bacterium N1Y90]
MNIDHIGVITKSIENSINQWTKTFGYKQATKLVNNTRQKVNVVFMKKEGSIDIKLVEPSCETSPIYKFAMRGGGLHHLCFKSDKLDNAVDFLTDNNCLLISKPQPGEAFENENIAFLLSANNLNIELIDTDKRANKING